MSNGDLYIKSGGISYKSIECVVFDYTKISVATTANTTHISRIYSLNLSNFNDGDLIEIEIMFNRDTGANTTAQNITFSSWIADDVNNPTPVIGVDYRTAFSIAAFTGRSRAGVMYRLIKKGNNLEFDSNQDVSEFSVNTTLNDHTNNVQYVIPNDNIVVFYNTIITPVNTNINDEYLFIKKYRAI
jgi:hypothetical protein